MIENNSIIMSEILNKYKRWGASLMPISDEYLDFVLSQDGTPSMPYNGTLSTECLAAYIDMSRDECIERDGAVSLSNYYYVNYKNIGVALEDFGFTGMDNGRILFNRNFISNREFLSLLTNSPLKVPEGDVRLHLQKVSGNTRQYDYTCDFVEQNDGGYYSFRGGFLQGFYKLFGFEYEVLPQYIEDEWNLEFVLRPRDYETGKILNKKYPDNAGIFFYMGTRAENKFARFYGDALSAYTQTVQPEPKPCDTFATGDYFLNNQDFEASSTFARGIQYFDYVYGSYGSLGDCLCSRNEKKDKANVNDCGLYFFSDDFIEQDVDFSKIDLTTADGKPLLVSNYFEIETDNKFLLFNRACGGSTVRSWDEDTKYVLTGTTHNAKDNLFLIMNRTCNGYTARNIESYYANGNDKSRSYDITNDNVNNSFALKYNEDGSIGFKYLVRDCDSETKYSIVEGSTLPNLIVRDEWSVVHVKFRILNGNIDKCGNPLGERKMKMYIYVNGYLKYVSEELPEFNFRELNDTFDKQEGVPFNISLGGGTQGLIESLWTDFHENFPYVLPIEENFAGSFIGDMRSFKFYTCSMEYAQIRNNFLYEKGRDIKSIY